MAGGTLAKGTMGSQSLATLYSSPELCYGVSLTAVKLTFELTVYGHGQGVWIDLDLENVGTTASLAIFYVGLLSTGTEIHKGEV